MDLADDIEGLFATFEREARARAIRAVVAAQWGEALCVGANHYSEIAKHGVTVARIVIESLAALPTPAQIVDGVE